MKIPIEPSLTLKQMAVFESMARAGCSLDRISEKFCLTNKQAMEAAEIWSRVKGSR